MILSLFSRNLELRLAELNSYQLATRRSYIYVCRTHVLIPGHICAHSTQTPSEYMDCQNRQLIQGVFLIEVVVTSFWIRPTWIYPGHSNPGSGS